MVAECETEFWETDLFIELVICGQWRSVEWKACWCIKWAGESVKAWEMSWSK